MLKHLELAGYRKDAVDLKGRRYTFTECGSLIKDFTRLTTDLTEVTCKICAKRARS